MKKARPGMAVSLPDKYPTNSTSTRPVEVTPGPDRLERHIRRLADAVVNLTVRIETLNRLLSDVDEPPESGDGFT